MKLFKVKTKREDIFFIVAKTMGGATKIFHDTYPNYELNEMTLLSSDVVVENILIENKDGMVNDSIPQN